MEEIKLKQLITINLKIFFDISKSVVFCFFATEQSDSSNNLSLFLNLGATTGVFDKSAASKVEVLSSFNKSNHLYITQ